MKTENPQGKVEQANNYLYSLWEERAIVITQVKPNTDNYSLGDWQVMEMSSLPGCFWSSGEKVACQRDPRWIKKGWPQ